jgi:hypothetical protein
MMRIILYEEDIGKSFEIYGRKFRTYFGKGILFEVHPFNIDEYDRYFKYIFLSYLPQHLETSDGINRQFHAQNDMFQYLDTQIKIINPQLKTELQRRVFTKKYGRLVNELTNLPLDIRKNIFIMKNNYGGIFLRKFKPPPAFDNLINRFREIFR